MFDYDNPDERQPVDFLTQKLRDKIAKYERHAAAKMAAESGAKDSATTGLSLRAMMALSASDETRAAFETFQQTVAEAFSILTNSIRQGDEHVYANAYDTLNTATDVAKKIASDWAPKFKPATVQFTDGDLISDEALAELRNDCDNHFRKTIQIVDQLAGRVEAGDASVQSLIESIIGWPTTVRTRNDKAQFSLAITRFRSRNEENVSQSQGSKKSHLVLMVDGEQAPGNSWLEQVQQAFGLSGPDLLDKLTEAARASEPGFKVKVKWHTETDYLISHAGQTYIVNVNKRDGDWPVASE